MVVAGAVCGLLALVVLVAIELWRRRTAAALRALEERRAMRERAWETVRRLDREAA